MFLTDFKRFSLDFVNSNLKHLNSPKLKVLIWSKLKLNLSNLIGKLGISHGMIPWDLSYKGCGSVILLRPKMGVAPHKHDVISMPTQQCTNTKHISIERYHPVVSIMLRYLDLIKTFGESLCYRAVKIDKIFGVTYRTLLSNQPSVMIAKESGVSKWSIFPS